MSIKTRLENLEQHTGPRALSPADRLAAALDRGEARFQAMTPEQGVADERRRHQAALTASSPGPGATELAQRLYAADLRLARKFFEP